MITKNEKSSVGESRPGTLIIGVRCTLRPVSPNIECTYSSLEAGAAVELWQPVFGAEVATAVVTPEGHIYVSATLVAQDHGISSTCSGVRGRNRYMSFHSLIDIPQNKIRSKNASYDLYIPATFLLEIKPSRSAPTYYWDALPTVSAVITAIQAPSCYIVP